MLHVMKRLAAICKQRHGVTAYEYALIGSVLALAIVVSFTVLGNSLGNALNSVAAKLVPPAG